MQQDRDRIVNNLTYPWTSPSFTSITTNYVIMKKINNFQAQKTCQYFEGHTNDYYSFTVIEDKCFNSSH